MTLYRSQWSRPPPRKRNTKRKNAKRIIEKAREFQKNIYFCFIDYAKAFDCVDHNKLWKILKEMRIPDHLTWLLRNPKASEEALQIAEKREEAKGKGIKERYSVLNTEFQRIARRDKKVFLSGQCKEIEENNRIGKNRDLFRKLEIPSELFMQRWAQ